MQVMASDADDPTYGSSARLVYSVLDGENHFTVDPKTGEGRGHKGCSRGGGAMGWAWENKRPKGGGHEGCGHGRGYRAGLGETGVAPGAGPQGVRPRGGAAGRGLGETEEWH